MPAKMELDDPPSKVVPGCDETHDATLSTLLN